MSDSHHCSKLILFIESETKRIRKSTQKFYLVSFLAILGFTFYMTLIYGAIGNILESNNLAAVLGSQVEEKIPQALSEAKAQLKNHASVFADDLSHKFIRSIPVLRRQAQQNIKLTSSNYIPDLAQRSAGSIKLELSDVSYQNATPEMIARELTQILNAELMDALDCNEGSLTEKSHFMAMTLYSALKERLSQDKLSRGELSASAERLYARLLLDSMQQMN